MKIFTTYSVKIKHYAHIFKDTVRIYRSAVDMLIKICLNEWTDIDALKGHEQLTFVETLMHSTKDHPVVKYPKFDKEFYKFPSYLRRGAINEMVPENHGDGILTSPPPRRLRRAHCTRGPLQEPSCNIGVRREGVLGGSHTPSIRVMAGILHFHLQLSSVSTAATMCHPNIHVLRPTGPDRLPDGGLSSCSVSPAPSSVGHTTST